MKKLKKYLILMVIITLVLTMFSVPVFAVTEAEVQQKVADTSKEAVSGNIFIWFLCAIAFLKISQKIDSFMSGLGINVGHTGGSMLGEAMIAARTIGATKGGRGGSAKSSGSSSGTSSYAGGLAGMVSRGVTNSAINSVTSNSGGLSNTLFNNSLSKNGSFANNVIGAVAKGSISQVGTITGDVANSSLNSYMNIEEGDNSPSFSNVEIGGGRITGSETSVINPDGIQFAMYNAEQYTEPTGNYSTETAVDGSSWYKQYETNHVEKNPYMSDSGQIMYEETIIQKMPDMPKRKDRI